MNRGWGGGSILVVALALAVVLAVASAASAAAVDQAGTGASTESYLLLGYSNILPAGLGAKVAAAGGTVARTIPELGIAVVDSARPDFSSSAGRISGIQAVARNPSMRLQYQVGTSVRQQDVAPPLGGDDDFLYGVQWAHQAIGSYVAWNDDKRGAGARVAILDTGFDLDNPDLIPNLNQTLSRSFVPDETLDCYPTGFSHGTHVAGIVAAADNGWGVIGVAPEAELVLVKVLCNDDWGLWDWILEGLVYAAGDADADVISLSLGSLFYRHEVPLPPREVGVLRMTLARAAQYAAQRDALLVMAAGNENVDLTGGLVTFVPAEAPNSIAVAATAPIGWGADSLTLLDSPTSYTNFGRPVDFAAPGGDATYPGDEYVTVGGVTAPAWVFDLVVSDGPDAFWWAAGTSMATPHVTGAAAIVVGMNGGDMKPSQVKAILQRTAADLGAPGRDPYYGWGRIDVGKLAD